MEHFEHQHSKSEATAQDVQLKDGKISNFQFTHELHCEFKDLSEFITFLKNRSNIIKERINNHRKALSMTRIEDSVSPLPLPELVILGTLIDSGLLSSNILKELDKIPIKNLFNLQNTLDRYTKNLFFEWNIKERIKMYTKGNIEKNLFNPIYQKLQEYKIDPEIIWLNIAKYLLEIFGHNLSVSCEDKIPIPLLKAFNNLHNLISKRVRDEVTSILYVIFKPNSIICPGIWEINEKIRYKIELQNCPQILEKIFIGKNSDVEIVYHLAENYKNYHLNFLFKDSYVRIHLYNNNNTLIKKVKKTCHVEEPIDTTINNCNSLIDYLNIFLKDKLKYAFLKNKLTYNHELSEFETACYKIINEYINKKKFQEISVRVLKDELGNSNIFNESCSESMLREETKFNTIEEIEVLKEGIEILNTEVEKLQKQKEIEKADVNEEIQQFEEQIQELKERIAMLINE